MSVGKALEASVCAARASGIVRRVKSWTLSRSSLRSEEVGSTKPQGCLVDKERWVDDRCSDRGRERWIWRMVFVKTRGMLEVDMSVMA